MKRDTGVEVHGNDKTWSQTKDEQKEHVGGSGAVKAGVTAAEGAEIAGVVHGGAATGIALPVVGFGLAWAGLVHAHEDADAQKAAIVSDQAHVALAGALDLPGSCKQREFDARPGTPRDHGSKAAAMTEKLMKDPAGMSVLQAHCDRGVMSAFASVPMPMPQGMTAEKFLESRPQLKQICDEDAAFRVGFEAFFKASPTERKELLANVEKHDVRAGNGVHIGG